MGTDRGWAFVTYEVECLPLALLFFYQDETEAAVAVAMFNGQQIFPGSARPLHCKLPGSVPKIFQVYKNISYTYSAKVRQ